MVHAADKSTSGCVPFDDGNIRKWLAALSGH